MSLPGPGAAFCKRRSGVSIGFLQGAFSFLSARLPFPSKWGFGGFIQRGTLD